MITSGITSNPLSLTTQRYGDVAAGAQAKTLNSLSSGSRINSAADDAAGSAIIQQFAAQIAGNNQAARNLNDGISLAQTAEGALSTLSENTQRLRELSVAAGNSTLSASDRAALQEEANQLSQSNNDIISNSQFNGQAVLQGNQFTLQSGPNSNDQISFTSANLGSSSGGLSSARGQVDLSSPSAASQSIDRLDSDLQLLNSQRSNLGAIQSRLESGISNLQTTSINESAAKSRIGDTDYAAATSRLAQERIRSQAANAMQVQANAIPAQVLSLLRQA